MNPQQALQAKIEAHIGALTIQIFDLQVENADLKAKLATHQSPQTVNDHAA